ncbi:MAG: hypothetical protein PQ975_07270, partial [Methanobacterium sp.]
KASEIETAVKKIESGIREQENQNKAYKKTFDSSVKEQERNIRKKASEIETAVKKIESGIREQENQNKAYKKTFDSSVKEQERKNAAFVNEFYYGKAPPPEVKPVTPKKLKVTPKEEKK